MQYRTIKTPETAEVPGNAASKKRPLDHVRSTSLRLSGLHGTSDPEDAEYRCHGPARRAVFQRLRTIADLRPLTHVLLYRPLHAFAWLALERLAAACRRTDAGRSSQEYRRAQCAGRQDPYGAGSRRVK